MAALQPRRKSACAAFLDPAHAGPCQHALGMDIPAPTARPVAPKASLLPALLRLAGPVALARLGVMGMAIADVVMVGQMAPSELPFQALGWSPVGVLLLTGIGLLTGVQVLSAHAFGSRRPEDAGATLRKGLALGLASGSAGALALILTAEPLLLAFGVAPELATPSAEVARVLALSTPLHLVFIAGAYFLEGVQRPNAATVIMWVANLLNIGLNWALIPHLGAVGSAWATVGSRLFLAVALLGWIAWMPGGRAHRPFAFRQGPRLGPSYGALLRIGGAAALSQAAEAGAFSGMTVIAGRISADAVAAYQIVLNAMAVVFMVALGFASATAVLVAQARGGGDALRARAAAWTGLGANTLAMGLAASAFLLFPEPIARAYTSDLAVQALCVAALPFAALALPPDGAQVVLAQALRAREDNWFPTLSHVLAYVLVMPPLGWLLAERLGGGAPALFEAILWASVLSAAVLAWRQWRLR